MVSADFLVVMYTGLIFILFGLLLLLGYKKKGILDKKAVISPFGILLIGIGEITAFVSLRVNLRFYAGLAIMFTGVIILFAGSYLQVKTAVKKLREGGEWV